MSASCGSEDDDFAAIDINGELTINGIKYYVGNALYYRSTWGEKGIWIELPLHESKEYINPDKQLIIVDKYHNNISEYGSGITINGLDGEGYENITVYDYGFVGVRFYYYCWDVISGKVSVTPSGKNIKIQFHNFKFQKDADEGISFVKDDNGSLNYVVNGTATVRPDGAIQSENKQPSYLRLESLQEKP